MSKPPLRERARGQWRAILTSLGVSSSYLSGKHGPCPICGEGKDRFRFDNRDGYGTWICSRCGAGDGASLVMQTRGVLFADAARLIEGVIGDAPRDPPTPTEDRERQKGAMRKMWRDSQALQPGDPVTRFFEGRGIRLDAFPPDLRFVPRLRYQDGRYGEPSQHPAMIALVRDRTGQPLTLHRTYLTSDGRKADVARVRKMAFGRELLTEGASVRLTPVAPELGIAEGIETAFAAGILHDVPCWAALNSGLLKAWEPPDGVRVVYVFADNDTHHVGLEAAAALAQRLSKAGVHVRFAMPPTEGTDWNDVLMHERGKAAA